MRKINLIHLGIGNVGGALVRLIKEQSQNLKIHFGVHLNYCGIFISRGGIFNPHGLTEDKLIKFPQNINSDSSDAVLGVPLPFIVVDTTSSTETYPSLLTALKRGGYIVLSNKKPLTGRQEQFDLLNRLGKRQLFYETTVGAALPVIQTLKTLIDTGDEIIEIKGCFSGTLGFLFSCLEEGSLFSEAVIKAKEKGFTEPDPRDDLSGLDVARKALILARILGRRLELSDISLECLYPRSMDKLTIEEFLDSISQLDSLYQKKFRQVKQKGKTLRFVASVSPKSCKVGIESVEKESDLGSLAGPDNLIIFKTKRYFDRPLVIKGPGAGVEVTAAGVFADILAAGRKFYGKN